MLKQGNVYRFKFVPANYLNWVMKFGEPTAGDIFKNFYLAVENRSDGCVCRPIYEPVVWLNHDGNIFFREEETKCMVEECPKSKAV